MDDVLNHHITRPGGLETVIQEMKNEVTLMITSL